MAKKTKPETPERNKPAPPPKPERWEPPYIVKDGKVVPNPKYQKPTDKKEV